jgi:SAM-dependent methyltransferase
MRDRPTFDLFLVSWLVLFLELTCIRWFPSHVMFLTFFTNIVLLASFVGMSVGCLVARSPTRHIARTPMWLAVAVAAGVLVERLRLKLLRYVALGETANPDVIFFGAEVSALNAPSFRIPVEVVAGLFFVLIAVVLVGPGQEMGRAFNRVPSRTRAYSVNLLGSLAGIASFAACSYLELPPVVWFAAVALGVAHFVYRPSRPPGDAAGPDPRGDAAGVRRFAPAFFLTFAVLLSLITSGVIPLWSWKTMWSPYYRIDYQADYRLIETNLISHQMMEPREHPAESPYSLPYLFQRDVKGADGRSAWPQFRRVLIIGAGSGNDVSRALQWLPPDARIDAVEIDPVIQRLGEAQHPDRPYQDSRVSVHLNDGRNFLRRADPETYDLVIFALVDSLVLQSGYSNLRLESYLFTEESFRDVRRALKPTGVCAVYNFFRHGWLVVRLRDELRAAFDGADPVVLSAPALGAADAEPLDRVGMETYDPRGFTAFFAGRGEVIDPLRAAFAAGSYWYPWFTGVPGDTGARFGPAPELPPPPPASVLAPDGSVVDPKLIHHRDGKRAEPKWLRLRPVEVGESGGTLRPATDDWPFLYVRYPTLPLVSWRGMLMMVGLSLLVWWMFRPRGLAPDAAGRPDHGLMARSFFLGAGFMLVETKAVVHMALLFGSTWMVNTVVFAAVLLMSLAGNLFAGWAKPRALYPYYLGLFAALAAGLAIPLDAFLGLDRTTQVVGACALVFAPIAFAGVIFATSFGRSTQPDRVFGANVAGALLGGLSENASVLLGFQYLLCVAVGFYALSAACGNRTMPIPSAGKRV